MNNLTKWNVKAGLVFADKNVYDRALVPLLMCFLSITIASFIECLPILLNFKDDFISIKQGENRNGIQMSEQC